MSQKQVDRSHYQFTTYMDIKRWISVWHQLDEVIRLQPQRVLEIGPGPGVFKAVGAQFDIRVETLDLDPALKPDHVASVTAMPFADGSFDVVCAFQMLEHLPYSESLKAFAEMVRVSRGNVIISLPDLEKVQRYQLRIPKLISIDCWLRKLWFRPRPHRFDGQHHWEINKLGYELDKVIKDFAALCPLLKTYRVHENPYHRFFVFKAGHQA